MITKNFRPSKNLQALQVRVWEQRLASRGLAPLDGFSSESLQDYAVLPFVNALDASLTVTGTAPTNQRDAVPSHDGCTTYSPMDTEDILFAIFQDSMNQEIQHLALSALKSFVASPKSITTAVSILVLNQRLQETTNKEVKMTTHTITRNENSLPENNPRGVLNNFQFGTYTYKEGILTTPKGWEYSMTIEDYLHDFQPFSNGYIAINSQTK